MKRLVARLQSQIKMLQDERQRNRGVESSQDHVRELETSVRIVEVLLYGEPQASNNEYYESQHRR